MQWKSMLLPEACICLRLVHTKSEGLPLAIAADKKHLVPVDAKDPP